MTTKNIIQYLHSLKSPTNIAGMARFGIRPKTEVLGISLTFLRKYAKTIGKNHKLALELWKNKIHEARILAALIDEPDKVTEKQMDQWVKNFDSWDICDTVCGSLFDKTPFAHSKAKTWAADGREFIRRAGFALMAWLAVHDKAAKNVNFEKFLPLVKSYSTDERNFVRKAVNWALRQIGKRNTLLNKKCIQLARVIEKMDSKSAKWIAKDALKELKSDAVQKRLSKD